MSDWEYADKPCPKCGTDMHRQDCPECGGEGDFDAHDEDPLYYDPGDRIPCDNCHGHGVFVWCPKCQWNDMDQCFDTEDGKPKT